MEALLDYARDRFVVRVLLATAIVLVGLLVRKLVVTLVSRWITLKDILPRDYPLKRSVYRVLLGVLVPLTAHIMLPLFELPERIEEGLSRGFQIAYIVGITLLCMRLATLVETAFIHAYNKRADGGMSTRRLMTQIAFIHRIIVVAIVVLGVGSALLTFPGARRIGASLLASAGVASIVVGLAAQRSLGNLIAGFQIAFTQPLRIDDVVVVEGQQGRVEEITLTYVVVRLWDYRRLLLPITYFVEKPFENWTRNTTDLLGDVKIYADYRIPVEAVRTELLKILGECELWNHQVASLQVNGLSERGVELRAVVSARNHADLSDLRAFVRERLVGFIQEKHPHCFPTVRTEGPHPAPLDA